MAKAKRRMRALGGGALEGVIFGTLGAVLPIPSPLYVLAGVLLVAALTMIGVVRDSRLGCIARLGIATVVMAIAASLPFNSLDRRLELASDPSAGEILEALERPRIHVRVPPDFPRTVRVAIDADPRAREALDALSAATGLPWRSRGCATGANLLFGLDGVGVIFR